MCSLTLIAEKEGQQVAKIHGPYRTDYVLEYRKPGSGQVTRVSRSNPQALRVLADLLFPDVVWRSDAAF